MNNLKNKGMFLETILNYTIKYYYQEKIALFYQRPIDIIPVTTKFINNKKIITKGYFKAKSSTDFYGTYKGKYIEFEAKTCNRNKFFWKQILQHQWLALENVEKFNGTSFIIIYFSQFNRFFLILYKELIKLKKQNLTSITIEKLNNFEIFIEYPLIINFIKYL